MSRPSRPAHPAQDARVFLFHCDAYDVARIRALVGQAMALLGLRPHGRTLVKPNLVAELGGIQNPYFDKRQIVGFNRSYLAWRGSSAWKRVLGKPYQIHGATTRGEARPEVEPAE